MVTAAGRNRGPAGSVLSPAMPILAAGAPSLRSAAAVPTAEVVVVVVVGVGVADLVGDTGVPACDDVVAPPPHATMTVAIASRADTATPALITVTHSCVR